MKRPSGKKPPTRARILPHRPKRATLASPSAPVRTGGARVHAADTNWLADFFQHAPFAILKLDPNGVIEQANGAACALLGRTASELDRRPLLVLAAPASRAALLEHLRALRHSDAMIVTACEFTMRDGARRQMHLQSKRLLVDGGRESWTVLVSSAAADALGRAQRDARDAAERATHSEQDAQQARRAKAQLLALLSHELRTPLTPVMFAVDRLRGLDALPPAAAHLIDVIKRNVDIEAHLIADLLDVTRVGQGRLEVRRHTIDAHDVLLDALEVSRSAAEQRRTVVVTHLDAPSHHVSGDRGRLRQVFWNLAINAVKFTPQGRVTVRTANDADGRLLVTFDDTGVGMDGERLGKLFVPFEGDPSSAREGGLGLGLTIAKGIVEAHGGRIQAASDGLGQGSTFTIELPTVESLAAREGAAPVLTSNLRCRILLVEDDPDTAEMLTLLLTSEGHELRVARTLRQAIELTSRPWDVILSDLRLPDGSGLELARHVRTLARVPRLIALSGYGTPEDVQASWQAGFHQHLVKPIDFEELRRLLPRRTL